MEQQQLNILRVLESVDLEKASLDNTKVRIDGDKATIGLDRLPYKDGKLYNDFEGAGLLKAVNTLLDAGAIKAYEIKNLETYMDGISLGGAYDLPGVKLYSGDLVLKGIDKKKLNEIGMDLAVATNGEALKNIKNLMTALGVTSEPSFQNGILVVPDVSTEDDRLGRETAKRIVKEAENEVKKLPKHMPKDAIIQLFINEEDGRYGIEILTDSREKFIIKDITEEIIKPVLREEIKKFVPKGFYGSLNKPRGGDDLFINIQPSLAGEQTDTRKRLERLQLADLSKKLDGLGISSKLDNYDRQSPGAAGGAEDTRMNTPDDAPVMQQPHASLRVKVSFKEFRRVCALMQAELGRSVA